MDKVTFGPKTIMYPMPAVLVGSKVGGKPNYMTAAWCTIACMAPPMIAVAINQARHTLKGIDENRTFSVNIPSSKQVAETDYCGIATGARVDKSQVFTNFYGALKTAPMIKECPVNLECRLFGKMDCGSHDLVVGEIIETYGNKDVVSGEFPDVKKVDPIVYSDGKYFRLGEFVADAFSAGKAYKKK